jgi:hypothetical protein
MPITTYFVDSTPIIAPFMSKGTEHSFAKGLTFLGRSGVTVINGLRVAFVSGVDADMLGSEVRLADPALTYIGNYFVQKDIETCID